MELNSSNLPPSEIVDFFIYEMVATLLVDDKKKEPMLLSREELTLLFFSRDSKVKLVLFINAMSEAFGTLLEMTKNNPSLEGADGETPIDPKSST